MITFQEVVLFLVPPIVGGIVGVIIFQILDRLNIFYRDNTKTETPPMKRRAVAG